MTKMIINAWGRNGDAGVITGEALFIACLMKTVGGDRNGPNFKLVQKLMKDHNLD